jgi:endonuclease-3
MAATARAPKAADKQAVLKKLLPLIKKQYKVVVPKLDRPVMETMLYGVCLEDAPLDEAEKSYARIFELFPDLNEARVSSVTELEPIFAGLSDPDWRSFRLRSVLQYVFDKSFAFELESLRKKTLELATKQLQKIKQLSPFVRTFTLQQAVGAHLLPLDESSARVLTWLGLSTPGQTADELGESLKAIVRKADALQFCFAVRSLATDPKLSPAFDPAQYPPPDGGYDAHTGIDRLNDLFKTGLSGLKVKPKAEPPAKAVKKAATKDPVKKAVAKKDKPAAAKAAPKPAKKASKK